MSDADRLPRLGRRAVTIPLFVGAFMLALALLPIAVPLAAGVDRLRGEPLPRARCLLFFAWYFACESAGILAAGACSALEAAERLAGRANADTVERRLFRLECAWATALFGGAQRIFGMRVSVEGLESAAPGPLLVFCRHASLADTVLPAVLLSGRLGLRLRYVLKRELLWDPCLDLVGNRLPNCFVRRGSGESAREIAAVAALADGLGPQDGVLIYPEGTRFTVAKRERFRARLASASDPALAAAARAMEHVLPPRLGGPLALLARAPDADALFCAHTGFEGAGTFADLWAGSLIARDVRVAFWRVPAAQIPRTRGAATEWLLAEWRRVDAWIGAHATEGRG